MQRWLLLLVALALTAATAQDVFVGGRVDLELTVARDVDADFGRLAGIDLTFSQPGVIDAYFDLSVAGGRARVQELYVSPPQTRRVVDITLGRFLLPYGDPLTDPIDRYAEGGRDLYDTYRGFRRGNVFLDTDVTGLWLHRRLGPLDADLVGAITPGSDEGAFAARLTGGAGGVRAGGSLFLGTDVNGGALRHGALHLGYEGHGVTAVGQLFAGEASGGDFRGWIGRVEYRLPPVPLDLFAAQTLYNDDVQTAATTTRVGARYRFDDTWRLEARYEINDAVAAADRFVMRLNAVF